MLSFVRNHRPVSRRWGSVNRAGIKVHYAEILYDSAFVTVRKLTDTHL